ncbi:MAG: polysaccharide deacetylase family protein [Oligoflexia bacterium]|nr:polysaccharide deacetylase family protein [Oligoflexia bacterium]
MIRNVVFLILFGVNVLAAQAAPIKMAITVDDLPVHGSMPEGESRLEIAEKMLKAFEKHNLKGVYGFINAKNVDEMPETFKILKLWKDKGQFLANHTYSHISIQKISSQQYIQDILKNEVTLKKLATEQEYKFFRYPFLREGETVEKRETVREFLKQNHYQIAQVTVDFDDWYYNEPYAECKDLKAKTCVQFLKDSYLEFARTKLKESLSLSKELFGRDIKHILLLHIGAFNAEMMDDLLKTYKKMGVEFIPLQEAVNDPIYKIDSKFVAPKSLTFLEQIQKMGKN